MDTLGQTNYKFSDNQSFYRGKVRDVYTLDNELLIAITTDRLSAFNVIMPREIPFKGQVINQIASFFLEATKDIAPNWLHSSPDPNVSIGTYCQPFRVEMIIRGYLAGHLGRLYASGCRTICGVSLPDGLKENDPLPEPIITPTTKMDGMEHDADISRADILKQGIVNEADYLKMEQYTKALFKKGTEMADKRGLILVDTKYEFGKDAAGNVLLIDEVHTPDSSRYFHKEGYQENQAKGLPQKQLSKEFVREWLIGQGFTGKKDQTVPTLTDEFVQMISDRYIALYEQVTGQTFMPANRDNTSQRIEQNIRLGLKKQAKS